MPPLLYATVVAAGAALGFLATLLPARLALRSAPVTEVQVS